MYHRTSGTKVSLVCYIRGVNLILFEEAELGKPLHRTDNRTVHLIKVLHKGIGDTFDAGVLEGLLGTGTITAVHRDGSVEYSLCLDRESLPRLPLRMAVGFPRPIQLRRLLRDLSNLGVAGVDLLGSDLGEKSYRDTKLLVDGGARSALLEGAIQARDTSLPELSSYSSLDLWLKTAPWKTLSKNSDPVLVALDNIRPSASLADLDATTKPMVLAVGSERGWSDRERMLLDASGFRRLSMGRRALRTETACTAAVVLAMDKIGELRYYPQT